MTSRSPYAWICTACSHESSRHGLAEHGDLRAGPYVCSECGCKIAQDHEAIGMSERMYREWNVAGRPKLIERHLDPKTGPGPDPRAGADHNQPEGSGND